VHVCGFSGKSFLSVNVVMSVRSVTKVKIRFSQKWAKEKYADAIRKAINFVKRSRSCNDLLVKVFFYRAKNASCGNFRSAIIHGSYESDLGIQNIITLKFSDRIFVDPSVLTENEKEQMVIYKASFGRFYKLKSIKTIQQEFVELFAHEFKHYLDMHDLMDKSKYRHWEVRAEKFAKKMVEKWKANENA